jgi:hypothetical protein
MSRSRKKGSSGKSLAGLQPALRYTDSALQEFQEHNAGSDDGALQEAPVNDKDKPAALKPAETTVSYLNDCGWMYRILR